MDIGKLNQRITFQKQVDTIDEIGQTVKTWVDFKTTWANVNPTVGKTYYEAKTLNTNMTYKINLRFRNDIDKNMRIKFKDRILDINDIINVNENNIELVIMAVERVDRTNG